MGKNNIFIATSSFGSFSKIPNELLKRNNIISKKNKTGRKLDQTELIKMAKNFSGIIAGTEKYDRLVIDSLPNLQAISRLGLGMDNIDMESALERNIKIFKDKERLKNKWDMVNFGSSIQYLENINLLNKINFKSTKLVLITHTPFSLLKNYVSVQTNNKNLYQNIHSFNDVVKFFKKKGLELIFKSRNQDRFISAKKKYNTFSKNIWLIFAYFALCFFH